MIRAALIVLAVVAVAVLIIALRGEPGSAELTWLHWNVRTTAAAAAMLLIFFTLAASVFWRALIWLSEAPQRAARARAEVRRRQGSEALTRGFVAAAGGDGVEARRQAGRAATLVDETPALVRLLSAQAAEAAGDAEGARAAYATMLGFPELRMAAHRGLMQSALAEGDLAEARRHAEAAYGLARTAPWAWRAVLEGKLAAADWAAALDLVQGALERKIVSPIVAERARAALLTAAAAAREADPDERTRHAALDDAQAAARLRPDFAPAAVIAARLLANEGRAARAAQVIEAAWKVAPHPALWLAYRDLKTDETPRERAARLATLAAFNPEARESRILAAEQALVAGDAVGARVAAKALEDEPLTRRLAGLRARIATAIGDRDEARAWTARGADAPQEPDWSDLDPEGRAFAYTAADWARIAQVYAERGELTHPRFERRERGMSDLPELPPTYAESAAFISAAERGEVAAPIVDDSDFAADLDPAAADAGPAPARPRRLFGGDRPKRGG
ncbi:MAG TPA: heme biosynthesis HemY N-terminal domain-containing protein [Caulobacteraceae bacterium]|nr:heme biosynthesis HemY N-terminal domain-containing protein [Caulobacteraceae bacterium]